jgi:hypothetical protein
MRKVMLLAAMLAMVLAAAAPAFAQAVAIDEGDDVEYNAVCQNILAAWATSTRAQDGDADATAWTTLLLLPRCAGAGRDIEQVNDAS